MRRRLPLTTWLAVGLCLAMLLGVGYWFLKPPPQNAPPTTPSQPMTGPLKTAQTHLAARRWTEALAAAETVLGEQPEHAVALLIAGEAATRLERYSEALAFYRRVPASATPEYLSAILAAAEIQRVIGSLAQAETLYRRALAIDPQQLMALDRLAMLLKLTARHEEARPLLLELLLQGAVQFQHLKWLADPDHPLDATNLLEQTLQIEPDQVFANLGLAEGRLAQGDVAAARTLLTALREQQPQHPAIEALYARCLWSERDFAALAAWQAALTEPVREHPDIWHIQGLLAEEQQHADVACRCHLECLRRNPDHQPAAYRAGRLLIGRNQTVEADRLLTQSERLRELATLADRLKPENPDPELCQQLVSRLEQLGRDWEAYGWTKLAARLPSADQAWVQATAVRLEPRLEARTPFDRTPVLTNLSEVAERLPLPSVSSTVSANVTAPGLMAEVPFSFVDESGAVGIEFTYFDDPDPATPGRRMHEFTGGGVAVLDYDLNGWPDLYFTQGSELGTETPSAVRLDQLFRNRGDGRFDNVTGPTRIVEDGFSQGVSAGDYNNDGFPDLYVANFGQNRLFQNLGDGTFTPIELPDTQGWTTSCAIADINLDGVPDLYDVNYVAGPDLLTRICPTTAGPRVCAPYAFAAADDRLLLGQRDGTFADVTATANINPPGGKGLGILIGHLSEGDSPVDVFVANDTEPNFLLINRQPPGSVPRYHDVAISNGVAFDHAGKAQACMGIAAADFDHNGRLDFFVTNYFNESNALYMGDDWGFFEDRCQAAGLKQPSFPMLGFGTQAIDADLDGHADLVVSNGDLDDFTHEGRLFAMRPQLFLNDGQARFTEWLKAPAEDYFAMDSAHRGRGLAWLDWNRDGRPDFVVSHLDEPSALVTNRTQTANGFVALQFVGTESSRDAIGTRVVVSPEARPQRRQHAWLTGGDGYQGSNERRLLLGVGSEAGPLTLELRWPGGQTAVYRGVAANRSYVCVEGGEYLVELPSGGFHNRR